MTETWSSPRKFLEGDTDILLGQSRKACGQLAGVIHHSVLPLPFGAPRAINSRRFCRNQLLLATADRDQYVEVARPVSNSRESALLVENEYLFHQIDELLRRCSCRTDAGA